MSENYVHELKYFHFYWQPMPGEIAKHVYKDEEMKNAYIDLRKSFEYCEVW